MSVKESAQKKKGGEYNTMWHNKTATMIEKVAKVRALREAFVEQLGGMYEAEEFGVILPDEPQADVVYEDAESEVIDTENPSQVTMDDI